MFGRAEGRSRVAKRFCSAGSAGRRSGRRGQPGRTTSRRHHRRGRRRSVRRSRSRRRNRPHTRRHGRRRRGRRHPSRRRLRRPDHRRRARVRRLRYVAPQLTTARDTRDGNHADDRNRCPGRSDAPPCPPPPRARNHPRGVKGRNGIVRGQRNPELLLGRRPALVVHARSPTPLSSGAARSLSRARAFVLFTVPIATPRTAAVSRSVRSST